MQLSKNIVRRDVRVKTAKKFQVLENVGKDIIILIGPTTENPLTVTCELK